MDKEKLKELIQISNLLLDCQDLEKGIRLLTDKLKEIIKVDRVSIFIYSKNINMVWTYIADGIERLVLPADKGIVGYVIKYKTIKKVNDTSKEPLFYKEVDELTGYKTKNILTIPLLNNDNEIIGVVQLLNKDGKFNKDDINIAYLFSNYISPPLQMLLSKDKE
jgi:GAF domain-containing protein